MLHDDEFMEITENSLENSMGTLPPTSHGKSGNSWSFCNPDALALFPELFEHEEDIVLPGENTVTCQSETPVVSRQWFKQEDLSDDPPSPGNSGRDHAFEYIRTKRSRGEAFDDDTESQGYEPPTLNQPSVSDGVTQVSSSLSRLSVKREVGGVDLKRRRVIMETVEITTPSWVSKKIKKEQDEKFLNPKWKIKRNKEDEAAGFTSVFRRVDALGIKPFAIPLDDEVLDFTVSRDFISDVYGGNSQETFPRISPEKLARHGYGDFMFLNILYNPRAPQRAGFPGLFYRSRSDNLPKFHRVFIRVQENAWLYLGQYELVPSEPLTIAEWKQTSRETKKIWTEKICTQTWSRQVRVRIFLRNKHHREPTIQEIEKYSGDVKGITPETVMKAYDNGQERLGAWVMKCIGYDQGFLQDMIQKRVGWNPKVKSSTTKKSKKKV